jgi:serine protease Do
MIRKTVKATQEATFCILLPHPRYHGMPTPTGTGFFVSPDGWLISAAHVVTETGRSDGPPRKDITNCWLEKEPRISSGCPGAMCQFVSLEYLDARTDFALLKVDFNANANKDWLAGRTTFPYIQVSTRELEEGEPVYSFGYPLSEASAQQMSGMTIGSVALSPRVTAAIVSSTLDETKMVMTGADPKIYVLDRALNYGNSGGPIVAADTGSVHAFCSRFQPMFVPQPHLKDNKGQPLVMMTPSLYGIVSSLANPSIVAKLTAVGVKLSDQ